MQLAQPQFKIYTHTVPGQGQIEIARAGTFINCLDANGPFSMALNDGAPTEFSPGLIYDGNVPFDRVRLLNNGIVSVTVKLAIGAGGVRDTRFVLEANQLATREQVPPMIEALPTVTLAPGLSAPLVAADPRRQTVAIQNQSATPFYVRHNNQTVPDGMRIDNQGSVSIATNGALFAYNPSATDTATIGLMSASYEV